MIILDFSFLITLLLLANIKNATTLEIKLFENSNTPYELPLNDNFEIINNLYGGIQKIKIINYINKAETGVIIKSSKLNSELSLNQILDIDDTLIFEQSSEGAIPGNYALELSPITITTSENDQSFATYYFGNAQQSDFDSIQTLSDDIYKISYIIEYYEKCSSCKQLGDESFYYCVKCSEENFKIVNNGEKCACEDYIFINENNEASSCLLNCDGGKYEYTTPENNKYCLLSCQYNGEQLYKDESSNICYKECSEAKNGNIYLYNNKCVNNCPHNYIPNDNNICILEPKDSQNTYEEKENEIMEEEKDMSIEKEAEKNNEEEIEKNIEEETEKNMEEKTEKNMEEENEQNIEEETEKNEQISTSQFTIIEAEGMSTYKENKEIKIISTNNNYETITITTEKITIIDNTLYKTNINTNKEILEKIRFNLTNNFDTIKLDNEGEIRTEQDGIIYTISTSSHQKILEGLKSTQYESSIDLSECENELTKKNIIEGNQNLYLLKLDIEVEGKITPQIEYEVYYYPPYEKNLSLLNLSLCSDIRIKIYLSLNISQNEIDKYNSSSSYYNDICSSFPTKEGIDVHIDDRRNEYAENGLNICDEGCEYIEYDYDTGKAVCSCLTKTKLETISDISNIKIDKNRMIDNF